MKYLLIISCLLFTSVGWSKDIDWEDLVKRDGLYYEKFTDVPFTGNITGEIQGKMSKGKAEGEWLQYYENGQLESKRYFKGNKIEGEGFWYHENGQLKIKGNFKDGKPLQEGEWIEYYESGQIKKKENYKDGKKDGEWLYYNKNGKLENTNVYKDGELIID